MRMSGTVASLVVALTVLSTAVAEETYEVEGVASKATFVPPGVGVGVFVGGGVLVGGTGVPVGGTGVFVNGGVLVGGTGVLVGGTGVLVGTGVTVAG